MCGCTTKRRKRSCCGKCGCTSALTRDSANFCANTAPLRPWTRRTSRQRTSGTAGICSTASRRREKGGKRHGQHL
nr:MAG TPA: Specific abundant protein [Caudoviricetes sp.]